MLDSATPSRTGTSLPWGGWPIVRPVDRARPVLLGLIYAAAILPMTLYPRMSGNVFSRYMTIEAIVERGTLAIERSPILARSGTPDIVRFGIHAYSDKPPVLPALAAPIYGALSLMGYRFSGSAWQFLIDNVVLTWSLVGLSSAWALIWVRRMFQCVPLNPWVADGLTLALGFASPLLTYGVTFNNHSVAAGLITAAIGLTVLEQPGPKAKNSRFWAGLLASLAMTIDLPAGGVVLASLGFIQTIRVRSLPLAYLVGSMGPLLLHAWLQSRVTGTPLPVEMYPEAFNYPGSYWLSPEGIWVEHGPRYWFGIELLFGPQGWFTVMPALLFGVLGLMMALIKRGDPLRPLALLLTGSVVVLVAYYTWGVRRTDFAGASFGTRHLLAVTPACYVFVGVALARLGSKQVLRWGSGALIALFLAIGGVYAYAGVKNPWTRIEKRAPTDASLQLVQRFVLYPWSSNTR